MFNIKIKRIYEPPDEEDGYRVLVDRLWPRGVTKAAAKLDEWNPMIAPSTDLRKWFNHQVDRFEEFKMKYKLELKDAYSELERLHAVAQKQNLCLLYGTKNTEMNQAVVLKDLLEKMRGEYF